VTLEDIPGNLWRDGVRLLNSAVYDRIMKLGNVNLSTAATATPTTEVTIAASDALIVPAALISTDDGKASSGSYRKSKQAKEVGDWAEAVALRYIRELVGCCSNCIHRADTSLIWPRIFSFRGRRKSPNTSGR
jgi:hypothetical protein